VNRTFIEQLITKHEGTRLSVYEDTEDNLTIGIGFNLDSGDAARICGMFGIDYAGVTSGTVILTVPQVLEIFQYQLNIVIGQAIQVFSNFSTMPDNVQAVICDVIFNIGIGEFNKFVNTIASLKAGNWVAAAANLKDSDWYNEVGTRGTDDVALLEAA
jgi:lysozyme